MRILILTQFFAPFIGGEEQHVLGLSTALAARGHEVAVVTIWHEGLPVYEVLRSVRVYRIHNSARHFTWLFCDPVQRNAPPFPDPGMVLELRQIILHERPEIVHAHNWLVFAFLPLKAWSGARLVMTVHTPSMACPKQTFVYRERPCTGPSLAKCAACCAEHYGLAKGLPVMTMHRVMHHLERQAIDLFLPVSSAAAESNRLTHRRLPLQVIPNFLPEGAEANDQELSSYLGHLPEPGFLMFVGALSRDKGLYLLLEAYAALADAPPLVVIGTTRPDTPTRFPPNVVVLRDWPNAAVMLAWRRSALALVPSLTLETFGIVVIEAMANGVPVIGSRIGAIPELIVHGETGFLVPPGDVGALRQAIQILLSSETLRQAMGEAGRRRALTYQTRAVIPQIEQAYRRALHAVPPRGAAPAAHGSSLAADRGPWAVARPLEVETPRKRDCRTYHDGTP